MTISHRDTPPCMWQTTWNDVIACLCNHGNCVSKQNFKPGSMQCALCKLLQPQHTRFHEASRTTPYSIKVHVSATFKRFAYIHRHTWTPTSIHTHTHAHENKYIAITHRVGETVVEVRATIEGQPLFTVCHEAHNTGWSWLHQVPATVGSYAVNWSVSCFALIRPDKVCVF